MHRVQWHLAMLILLVALVGSVAKAHAADTPQADPAPAKASAAELNLPFLESPYTLVTGKITANGKPYANTKVTLHIHVREPDTYTDSDGVYRFLVPERFDGGYWVEWNNPDQEPTLLDEWEAHGVDVVNYVAQMPTFDVGAPALVEPAPNAYLDMPITFRWQRRLAPGPGERYQMQIIDAFHGTGYGAWWPYPTEKETADCIISDYEIDFEYDKWLIMVKDDNGTGVTFTRPLGIGKTIICPK